MERQPSGVVGAGLAAGTGVTGALWAPMLLPWWLLVAGLGTACLLPRALRWLGLWALLGASWASLHAQSLIDARWPEAHHGADVLVRGHVIDIPERRGEGWRFNFAPDDDDALDGAVRVSWYRSETELAAGDCLTLKLRMRSPRGSVSPGAFDYERWLFANRLIGSAYVRDAAVCTASSPPIWQRTRIALDDWLGEKLAGHDALSLVRALTVANRNGISDDDWRVLRITGTAHLLAISGLHIGIVAGLFYALGRWGWRRSATLCRWLAAPRAGVLLATLAATAYAALAGFAVPTQRALLMWIALASALWLAHRARPFAVLALAWILVIGIDPLAVLSAGTWFSFVAVATLILVSSGRAMGLRAWLRIPRMQLALLVAMAPLTMAVFDGATLLAPAVNALAVPLFAVFMPLLLAAVGLAVVFDSAWPLWLPAEALAIFRRLLGWAAEHGEILWLAAAPSPMALACVALGAVFLLLPSPIGLRPLGLICLLPLFWPQPRLPHGSAEIAVLDVGQGLAVVVRTAEHALVYDAGPAWPEGFDAGDAIVAPYLRARGVRHIDRLVLSHPHQDHAGGMQALREAFSIGEEVGTSRGVDCRAGLSWQWDGVAFDVLYPVSPERWGVNNVSCVLRIAIGSTVALIPGDIEARGELALLRAAGAEALDATWLLAPHHGSRTSSTRALVTATRPEVVVHSAGWRNRYDHPHAEVVARWHVQGARQITTGDAGSVVWTMDADGVRLDSAARLESRRSWRAPGRRWLCGDASGAPDARCR